MIPCKTVDEPLPLPSGVLAAASLAAVEPAKEMENIYIDVDEAEEEWKFEILCVLYSEYLSF